MGGEGQLPTASPERNSRHGSPDLEDNPNRQSPRNNYNGNRAGQDNEDVSTYIY